MVRSSSSMVFPPFVLDLPTGRPGGAQSPSSVLAMAITTLSASLVVSFMPLPPFVADLPGLKASAGF